MDAASLTIILVGAAAMIIGIRRDIKERRRDPLSDNRAEFKRGRWTK